VTAQTGHEPSSNEARDGAQRSDPTAQFTARILDLIGDNADYDWSDEQTVAWQGFVDLNTLLQRRAPYASGGVSDSMLRIMGRLARTGDRTLNQTELAASSGLSLSRVSRIIAILEPRGWVRRTPSPTVAQATNITLTDIGYDRTRAMQRTVFEYIQSDFFDALTDQQVKTFAAILSRLIDHVGLGRS